MKKKILVFVVMGMLVANAAAIYCPECDFGDDEIRIMKSSEPSVPGIISEKVEGNSTGCSSDEQMFEGVDQEEVNGSYRLRFEGNMRTPDPCQEFGYGLSRNGSEYVLRAVYRKDNSSDVCTQCVGNMGYDAEITFNESYRMKIIHQETFVAVAEGGPEGVSIDRVARDGSDEKQEETRPEPPASEFNSEIGRITVSRTNSTCGEPDSSGIDYESIRRTDEGYSIEIGGYIPTANPCSLLNPEVEQEGDKTIVSIGSEESDMTCIQCTGKTGFNVDVETDTERFDLEIRHEDTVLKQVRRGYEQRTGFIARMIAFFRGLF